ncbi:MAG: hypothetical protein U1F76_01640 [Candidatus Competibacteraceae bacterium]
MTNSSENDSARKITVKIEKVQNATIIKGDNFFKEELKLAIGLINYILEHRNMDDERNNKDKENNWFHQHNTIAVLGPRGVGKTSFILTLRDIIENYNNKEDKKFQELNKKTIWLPNLDPTRMEENETFLATVVANILKTIRKNNDLDFNIREGLQSLSRDFSVLVSARVHEEQWKDLVDDPDSFAYNVLSNAHSGISLARSFHEFLGTCIRTLGKDEKHTVFVQPIDDIDTAIEQGWPILETIRKYLSTPHLITIITGDVDLYEILVRKQQLDKLSHLLENESKVGEKDDVRKIGSQIAQLTEQYLAKVIPSHLRIRLKSIADYITQEAFTTKKDSVYLEFDGTKNGKKPLSVIYKKFIKDLFGFHLEGIEALSYRREISRLLPRITRDLVRFFKALEPWYYTSGSVDKSKIEETLEALVQIFNAALYAGGISPNDLLLLKEGRHLEWLGEYCLNARQEVQEFWRLFPRYDDEEWNYRALLLNAFLFQSWKAPTETSSNLLYPHRPMSYGIKVLLPCLLADSRDLTGDKLLEMKRFLDIGNTERHFWMAIRSLAYRLRDSSDEWSKYGSGYVKVEESGFSIKWNNALSWFCHLMYRPNNGKALYADILIAIARLVDVLREGTDYLDKKDELGGLFNLFIQDRVWYLHYQPQPESIIGYGFRASGELTKNSRFSKIMYKLNNFKFMPISKNVYSQRLIKTEKAEKAKYEFSNQDKDNFKKLMLEWIQKMQKLQSERILTPPVIARTWRRFIDNLEYIRSDIGISIGKKDIELIDILRCWIRAFLNASLIEEVIFIRRNELNIYVENIRFPLSNDNDVFKKNLKKLDELGYPEIIYYTRAWMCCPLFLLFLRDIDNEVNNHIKKTDDNTLMWKNIIDEVKNISKPV